MNDPKQRPGYDEKGLPIPTFDQFQTPQQAPPAEEPRPTEPAEGSGDSGADGGD